MDHAKDFEDRIKKWEIQKKTGVGNLIDDSIEFEKAKERRLSERKNRKGNIEVFINGSIGELKHKVLELMFEAKNVKDSNEAKSLREEANELIVSYIKNNYYVKTIREDRKDPEMFIYQDGIYVKNARTYISEICREVIYKGFSTFFVNKVISKIEVDSYISAEDFFEVRNEYIIPVENGLLNIKTKELIDFSPEYIFTNKLPVKYDPEAQCNDIIKFFNDVLKEPSTDIKVLQEWIGYCLVKNYKFQHSTMFIGKGRNGKGVTLNIIASLLGKENISNLTLHKIETDKFSLSDLYNKYANIAGDLSKTALKESGYFKMLTGEDTITVDRKFLSSLSFKNYAKLMFSCNDLPFSYDDTDGFYDRWIIFDFPYKFVDNPIDKHHRKKDPDLKLKIITPENISGLLNWAIIGLKRLLDNSQFSYNKTSDDNRKKWKRQSSSFNAFFDDCCKVDFDCFTSSEELNRKYRDYCLEHSIKLENSRVIKNILESNLCDRSRNTIHDKSSNLYGEQVWGWKGLTIQTIQTITIIPPLGKKDPFSPLGSKHMDSLDNLDSSKKSLTEKNNEAGEKVLHDSDKILDNDKTFDDSSFDSVADDDIDIDGDGGDM